MFDLSTLIRDNIKRMKPYSSARGEFQGEASVFLDANENPFNNPYNRYPDPLQRKLKQQISLLKGVPEGSIFLGNGSDEPIDLLIRAFCEPGRDTMVTLDPTYGMYEVAANTNNVECRKVLLNEEFQMDLPAVKAAVTPETKLIFLCSPNNPTGNLLRKEQMLSLAEWFHGIVVVDEAYIDFAPGHSLLTELANYPNLVVLQTFSKAWGLAGIRLGMAFASESIIAILNKIKYPYNVNVLTQKVALEMLGSVQQHDQWVDELLTGRDMLSNQLRTLPYVRKVFPSDANFLLLRVDDPLSVYRYLMQNGIIVRNRHSVSLCAGCLRITIGSPSENDALLSAMRAFPLDRCSLSC